MNKDANTTEFFDWGLKQFTCEIVKPIEAVEDFQEILIRNLEEAEDVRCK